MRSETFSENEYFLSITDEAVDKLKEFLRRTGYPNYGLRLRVIPSIDGHIYEMDYEKKARNNDIVIQEKGLRIFVNKGSVDNIKGCKIDFYESLDGSSFRLSRPERKEVI